MASRSQFSIRDLMIVTLAVAIVCGVTVPAYRNLPPDQQSRALMWLAIVATIFGVTLVESSFTRRRILRKAGPMLARTEIGGRSLRWGNMILAIFLSAVVAYGTVHVPFFLDAPEYVPGLAGMLVGGFSLAYSSEAARLYLHRSWRTGHLVTEAFQNGLIVRGLMFFRWSDLISYESGPRSPTILVLNVSERYAPRPVRIRVAAEDRSEWERLFTEHGVPPASSQAENGSPSVIFDTMESSGASPDS